MSKYLISAEYLGKGVVIPVAEIENIVGMESTHPDFWKRKQSLKKLIAVLMRREDNPVTVRECNEQIEILLDAEASEYNFQWFRRHINAAIAAYQRLTEVDTRNLSCDQKRDHMRHVEVSSFVVQGISQSVRQISSSYAEPARGLPNFDVRVRHV